MARSLDLVQRARIERSRCFQGAQVAKGEEGAEEATLASDFNRQERWKKEIGGQESDKALRPRSVRGAPRAGQENAVSQHLVGRVD
ncbi:hypothetical protein MHB84_07045 [Paenibacillus sp. FSL F4-0087]|uniref:hypothetical protein n=1 Tax=Paenibacillus sp. FSL F4-0087 TaxID=2921368 RepID=UPI0030FC48A3